MAYIDTFEEFISNLRTQASDDILTVLEHFFINEGLEVTIDRRVLVTDKHEKLVDTSVENNPTLVTSLCPNVEVYSVFKRKQGSVGDGNPLLYALKNEKGYRLVNASKAKSRIEYIVNEFFRKHGSKDITIMIPSTNELNKYFANVVASHCSNPKYIDDIVVKMTIEEVDDGIFDKDSAFRKHYGKGYEAAYRQFRAYCKSMKNEIFRFHDIPDMEMRRVIERTMKKNDGVWKDYIEALNGKDIIIVDDSITFGNSILETCKIVTECFTPKSITILTLLSPLYCENGDELVNL